MIQHSHTRKKLSNQGMIDLHTIMIFVIVFAVIGAIGYTVALAAHKNKTPVNTTVNTQPTTIKGSFAANSPASLQKVNPTATVGSTIVVGTPSTITPVGVSGGTGVAGTGTTTGTTGTSTTPPPNTTYAVQGTVTETIIKNTCGPGLPACSTGGGSSSTPIANHVLDVYNYCSPVRGVACKLTTVTSATTDANGHFSFAVARGEYSIRLNPAVGSSTQFWTFTEIGEPLNLTLNVQSYIRT